MSEKEAPASTAYTRTLQLAAETVGGADALAKRFRVPLASLEAWIAGTEFPPHEVFLKALDVVAGGSLVESPVRRQATIAQARADRLQATANRVRESAERAQTSADRAQRDADRTRDQAERTDLGADRSAGKVRQVKPKDGKPASNKPDHKKSEEG